MLRNQTSKYTVDVTTINHTGDDDVPSKCDVGNLHQSTSLETTESSGQDDGLDDGVTLNDDDASPPPRMTYHDTSPPPRMTRMTYQLSCRRWLVLLCYCMLTLSTMSLVTCFPAIASVLKVYYNCSMFWITFLVTVFSIATLATSFPFSYLLERLGLATILRMSATFNLLGAIMRYFATSHTQGYWLLLLGNCLAGLSVASFMILPGKLASTWFGEREVGRAIAITTAVDSLGLAIGFLHPTLMVDASGDKESITSDLHALLLSQLVFAASAFIFVTIFAARRPARPPSENEHNRAISKRNYRRSKEAASLLLNSDDKSALVASQSSSPTMSAGSIDSDASAASSENYMTFKRSILALLKNWELHVIIHAHGLAASIDGLYALMLNEILTSIFQGAERNIGIAGFVAILLSSLSNMCVGYLLDRVGGYKLLSILVFSATGACCGTWLLLLEYWRNFVACAVCYCILTSILQTYYTIAIAHSIELSYPVSTGVVGMVLLLTSQIYEPIVALCVTALEERHGVTAFSFSGVVLAVVAVTLVLFVSNRRRVTETVDSDNM